MATQLRIRVPTMRFFVSLICLAIVAAQTTTTDQDEIESEIGSVLMNDACERSMGTTHTLLQVID